MRRLALSAAAMLVAAGCAHEPARRVDAPPPDLETFLAAYEGDAVCEAQDENFAMPVYVREEGDLRPVPTDFCAPVFPHLIQRRGYEAHCLVKFSVGENGAPEMRGTDCALRPAVTWDADWDAFALGAFTALSERAVAQSAFARAEGADPARVYGQPIRFIFPD